VTNWTTENYYNNCFSKSDLQPIQVLTTDKVKNSIMSLLNVCFRTEIQRNYLWNQQKTQFLSSLRLNIEKRDR
jgi:hypothetical protein